MDKLIQRISELADNRFSGTFTISFYKGSISKKVKLEVTENLKLDEDLTETDGTNSKEKS
jgi:lipoprotein NlpI